LIVFCAATLPSLSWAAQTGPTFPTHRFPTDESFHATYRTGWLSSSSNFVSALSVDPLPTKYGINLFRHEFAFEFQPSRKLSLGTILTMMSATVDNGTNQAAKTSPGDQFLFAEYRVYDVPGASVGGAFVFKIPGYNNLTFKEFQDTGASNLVIFGDGQSDITGLATAEYWPSQVIRLRSDVGYTYRTDQYSAEVPLQLALGFVTPRVEVDLRFRGNLTLRTDGFESTSTGLDKLKSAYGGTEMVYSANPWLFVVNPAVELWLSPKWGVGFEYAYSLFGNRAPYFQHMGLSLTYRWAKTVRVNPRTFKEVDIGTDQESGQFQGEVQGKDLEPKTSNPERIREESDEVFE